MRKQHQEGRKYELLRIVPSFFLICFDIRSSGSQQTFNPEITAKTHPHGTPRTHADVLQKTC